MVSSSKIKSGSRRRDRTAREKVEALLRLQRYSTSNRSVRELCEDQLRAMEAPISALKAQVDRLVAQLTPREREVLNQRFGISKGAYPSCRNRK